ncbi:hypothetical protein AX17_007519 [Amanita inopinata Kibby_2008]|nr:hypothetical protein AX17_007519 [Amanita inopinata Kibby_2008]
MKLTFHTSVVLSALLAAAPAVAQKSVISFPSHSSSPTTVLGATYWMNNDPSGNYLYTASIGSTGTLTLIAAYYTYGAGSHGTGPTPDALFSAGSVTVSRASNVVIVVNAGSDSVTTFAISTTDPTNLSLAGNPVYSGGDFPISVGINEAGTRACVLNTGATNGVRCFTVSPTTGLTPLSGTTRSLGLQQTTPPNGPDFTGSQVIFSSDETKLIAVVKGSPTSAGFLAMWDINADGSLSAQFVSMYGGTYPWSATYVNGANVIMGADGAFGFNVFNVGEFDVNPATVAQQYPVSGQVIVCWSEYSSYTGNYYLSDFGAANIDEVHIDSNLNPTVVNRYSAGQYAGNMDIKVTKLTGQPDHLYVLAANSTNIDVFSLNGPSAAALVQTLDVGGPSASVGLAYQPTYVYGMTSWVA